MMQQHNMLLAGGTVIDETGERRADVRVREGIIIEISSDLSAGDDELVDIAGCIVAPGFVDLHTHLREPGMPEAETIETGSRAAALGGYTAVVAMPNTDPTQDCVEVVEFVSKRGREVGLCDVRPSGSITIGRAGAQLTPFADLAAVGVHLFTDDARDIYNVESMWGKPEWINSRHGSEMLEEEEEDDDDDEM